MLDKEPIIRFPIFARFSFALIIACAADPAWSSAENSARAALRSRAIDVRVTPVLQGGSVYRAIDLGSLPGYSQGADAFAINRAGAVVGSVCCAATTFALTTAPVVYVNDRFERLRALPGYDGGVASAVNAAGDAVGVSMMRAPQPNHIIAQHTRAVAFSPNGIHDLGSLPGDTDSVATGVNDSGDAIGYSYSQTLDPMFVPSYSVVLFHAGVVIQLGRDGRGAGINRFGVAIGTTSAGQATLYLHPGSMALGTLGGPVSHGNAINDNGAAVGSADLNVIANGMFIEHAFVYEHHHMYDLGVPAGYASKNTSSQARAINNLGEIVGTYYGNVGGASRAFVYADGAMQDLTALLPAASGWTLQTATGINDCGEIVGSGIRTGTAAAGGGQPRAYLLELRPPNHTAARMALGCR